MQKIRTVLYPVTNLPRRRQCSASFWAWSPTWTKRITLALGLETRILV